MFTHWPYKSLREKALPTVYYWPYQFSLIKGRQILDCLLTANEIVDWLKKSNSGGLLFKVDFEKAFDSVSWVYVDFIMSLMGFSSKWKGWIHQCLSTVSMVLPPHSSL